MLLASFGERGEVGVYRASICILNIYVDRVEDDDDFLLPLPQPGEKSSEPGDA